MKKKEIVDKIYKGNPRRSCEIGAQAELIVAADLLRRGWHVFRSVSHTGPCDLIILKHGGTLRVEVKAWPSNIEPDVIEARFDILAIVLDGHVTYRPNINALDGW